MRRLGAVKFKRVSPNHAKQASIDTVANVHSASRSTISTIFNPTANRKCAETLRSTQPRLHGRDHCMKRSSLIAILTDVHLWVPVAVLILGIALLMTLR